jgi:hypothetical protein
MMCRQRNTRIIVYEMADSGRRLRVTSSTTTPSTSNTFSRSQSDRSMGAIASQIHNAAIAVMRRLNQVRLVMTGLSGTSANVATARARRNYPRERP